MKKKKSFVFKMSVLFAIVFTVWQCPVSVYATGSENTIPYSTVTYWDSDEYLAVPTKAFYDPETVLTAADIGVSVFSELTDMCTDVNNSIYILDGKASRITVIDSSYRLVHEITAVSLDGKSISFAGAKGIFVCNDGTIYIADTSNSRVLVCDAQGHCSKVITLPKSSLIPDDFVYKPIKITVDSRGYVYVLSDGSYYGAILYSPEGKFLGFYGANSVKKTTVQAIINLWKKITTTNEKRKHSASSLPYQFTDLFVDNANFIYTATGKTPNDTQSAQIKRLSPGGKNILNSDSIVFGNKEIATVNGEYRIQNIAGLSVDSFGYIYCYDVAYGKIYLYDSECYMLASFGGGVGEGTQKGTFNRVNSIDILDNGDRIVVADSAKLSITVFKVTDYGKDVKSARYLTLKGDYAASKELWQKILKEDRCCQLAYIGMTKAAASEKDYQSAANYAKSGLDKKLYNQVFNYIRKDFVQQNLTELGLLLFGILALMIGVAVYVRKKNIVIIRNKNVKQLLSCPAHPVRIFAEVKTKQGGSVILGIIVMVLFYVSAIIKSTGSGFLFKPAIHSGFNSLLVLLQTAGFVLLWTIANWGVSTLLGGIGKLREIFVVITYSIVPLVFANIVYIPLSYVLNISEGEFLTIFMVVMELLAVFMVIIGSMIIHDFSFGKFCLTAFLTFFGILIVIFFLILIIVFFQQAAGFIATLVMELFFR